MIAKNLVIVEDDQAFARTLARSFERRGYQVDVAPGALELGEYLRTGRPNFAVVDLKLGNGSGLPCIKALHRADPATRIVVLTGYASISTAVEAIKLGASHYLPKPCNTDEIEAAFAREEGAPGLWTGCTSRSMPQWPPPMAGPLTCRPPNLLRGWSRSTPRAWRRNRPARSAGSAPITRSRAMARSRADYPAPPQRQPFVKPAGEPVQVLTARAQNQVLMPITRLVA